MLPSFIQYILFQYFFYWNFISINNQYGFKTNLHILHKPFKFCHLLESTCGLCIYPTPLFCFVAVSIIVSLYKFTGKRKQCSVCQNCKAADCGKCRFCLDKKRFGGPACLKKCCVQRQCKFITPHISDEKYNMIQAHTTETLASIENKIENLRKL